MSEYRNDYRRQQPAAVEPENKLIAFAEGLAEWRKLRLTAAQLEAMRHYEEWSNPERHATTSERDCSVCGFPRHGFVRFDFPPNHPFFGKPICCPQCWPPPLGKNPNARLPGHKGIEKRVQQVEMRMSLAGISA